jgi:hypothetical protein
MLHIFIISKDSGSPRPFALRMHLYPVLRIAANAQLLRGGAVSITVMRRHRAITVLGVASRSIKHLPGLQSMFLNKCCDSCTCCCCSCSCSFSFCSSRC